jgi:ferredoxin
MEALTKEMKTNGADNVDKFILKTAGRTDNDIKAAAATNLTTAAERARNDARYRAAVNRKMPPRIDSRLRTFDCITCEKCIPVCPNAANFLYPSPVVAFDYHDVIVSPSGEIRPGPTARFSIEKEMQIGNYADFCNECGNCDTFCPEYGGPFIEKPSFHGTVESFEAAAPRDAFYISPTEMMVARFKQLHYKLESLRPGYLFSDGNVIIELSADHVPLRARTERGFSGEHRVDLRVYHTLRHILQGVLDSSRSNQINVSAASA